VPQERKIVLPKNLPPLSREGIVEHNGNLYNITNTPIGHIIRYVSEAETAEAKIENAEKYKLE